ncbi:MAG TPA: ABC transporter permease subunit, partial [Tabrizicola sp.]|nr:ABC transporter permease subunit [Tabrizicola sp.]
TAFLVLTLFLASAPALAFVLAILGVASLLVVAQMQPGKLLWFTLAYPALCFWLLWGGPIWTPIVAMAGFGVLYAVFRLASPAIGLAPAAGAGVVAAVLWWLFAETPIVGLLQSAIPIELLWVPSDEFGGFLLAIVIGVTGITFSLPLGILLALGRQSDMPIVKSLCVIFIEAIRGVPLITLLFVAAFVLGFFLPPEADFALLLRVLILVTFFAAAYLAEVLRGSLAALPRGQYEAADALGLDYWRAQRGVILPPAPEISVPAGVSSFLGGF